MCLKYVGTVSCRNNLLYCNEHTDNLQFDFVPPARQNLTYTCSPYLHMIPFKSRKIIIT